MKHYRNILIQIARLGDLVQAWPLVNRLIERDGEGQTALLVDERLADIAGMMVGRENVMGLQTQLLLKASLSSSLKQPWRLARQLEERLSALHAHTVLNLNYHRAAAAIGEAIQSTQWLGARYLDVVTGQASDVQLAEIFRVNMGVRRGSRHLSDIWRDYAGPEGWVFDLEHDSTFRLPPTGWNPLIPPLDYVGSGRSLLSDRGLHGESPFALIPGAGLPARQWPVWAWRLVAQELTRCAPVVLIGVKEEELLAEQIMSGLNQTNRDNRVVSLCGLTDMRSLAGVLSECRLAVGVDTGALHLAAAVGTPCLGLYYGSMHFRETGPYGPCQMVLAPERADYPCGESEMTEDYDAEIHLPAGAVITTLRALFQGESSETPGVQLYESELSSDGLHWEKRRALERAPLTMNRFAYVV